jgi:hypothetical protein
VLADVTIFVPRPQGYQADRLQLSKDEEGETGPDAEVTKEDQDKINSFSRLHNRERVLEEQLKGKQVREILLLRFKPCNSSSIAP